MRKGVSPLIASVILIAITMAVAVILANWVTSYTKGTIERLPTCTGGRVDFVTADYPKYQDGKLVAAVQATYVDLSRFTVDVIYTNGTAKTFSDTQALVLSSGSTGTVVSPVIAASKSELTQARIGTNCSDVKTEWASIK